MSSFTSVHQDFKRVFRQQMKAAIADGNIERVNALISHGVPNGHVDTATIYLAAKKQQRNVLEALLAGCPWKTQLAAMKRLFSKREMWPLRLLAEVGSLETLPWLAIEVVSSNEVDTMRWLLERTPVDELMNGLASAAKGNHWDMVNLLIEELSTEKAQEQTRPLLLLMVGSPDSPRELTLTLLKDDANKLVSRRDLLIRAALKGQVWPLGVILDSGVVDDLSIAVSVITASNARHDDVMAFLAPLVRLDVMVEAFSPQMVTAWHKTGGSDTQRTEFDESVDRVGLHLDGARQKEWIELYSTHFLPMTLAAMRGAKAGPLVDHEQVSARRSRIRA